MVTTDSGELKSLPRRRFLINTCAAAATGFLVPSFASAAPTEETQRRFHENVEAFRLAAIRRKLTGSWDDPQPIRLVVQPPASEAEILAVESRIGEALPKALRHFYATFSAGVDIRWFMPGRFKTTPDHLTILEFDSAALPPPPLQKVEKVWDGRGLAIEPTIRAGHMSFSLAETAIQLADCRTSAASFRKAAADDPEATLHYTRYAEWWERGFPLGLDGGGNVIAIDRQDDAGRMMWLAHDGADEPGFFIEHDLPGFMLVQSRLGFPGFGAFDYRTFYDHDVQPGDRQRRYLAERPGDEEAGLAPPSTYRIDDESDEAKIWRDWLGLKQG